MMILLPLLFVGLALMITGILLQHLPALRARRAARRGDIEAACQIYLSLLEENPEKIKYYRILGELYYRQQRTDEQAMRIYEIIVRLNIPFQWRDEILPWVAEHYLKEGRKDSEALAVIETAVQSKLKKINRSAP
jgi:tetratricopeptide (TPR) repeat protein